MLFSDIFRNFFGYRKDDRPADGSFDDSTIPSRSTFRDPIWKTNDDEYDDDDEMFNDFRNPHIGQHFDIFSDPLKITQYFEAQINDILKNFSSHSPMMPFSFNEEDFMDASPFDNFSNLRLHDQEEDNLRDKMLKPKCNDSGECYKNDEAKVDKDLDGNITSDEFLKMWNKRKSPQELQPPIPAENHSYRKIVTSQFVRKPDGTMEHKKIFKDGKGNEETVITRQIGDKKYVITTKKNESGEETKTEDLINIDETELQDFNKKWSLGPSPNRRSILDQFFGDEFFGPNPRL